MNYYPHYIDDFNSATRFSSRLERSIYRDMLDLYYEQEKPLPLEQKILFRKICVVTAEEVAAAQQVLEDFFVLTDGGWVNARCEKEIKRYHEKSEKSGAGGRAKAAKAEAALALAMSKKSAAACAPDAGNRQADSSILREGCAQDASTLCEPANQNQNQNHNQKKSNPVAQPTLSEDRAGTTTAVDLSIAMRNEGVKSQPADPRLIALAGQGVSVQTAVAACQEAKRSKHGAEVNVGYVVKILERWAAEAASLSVAGVMPPSRPASAGYESTKDRERRETIHALTGQSHHERAHEFIDINTLA
ncbi:uncharacterized protein YdaU (DUF1376 family) [Oxalobacteraceae bacterium GrIS 1.11]